MTSIIPRNPQVLWRWASGESAGVDPLGADSHKPAHRRLRALVALYWTEAAVEFGNTLGV